MSPASHQPTRVPKVELETVTRWPALLAAAGAGILLLGVPLLLALASALRAPPREAAASLVPQLPTPQRSVVVAPLEFPEAAPPPLPVPREEPRPQVRVVTLPPRVQPPPPAPPRETVEEPARQSRAPGWSRYSFRQHRSEKEYLEELRQSSRELDLDAVKGTSDKLLVALSEARSKPAPAGGKWPPHPLLDLLPKRPDLAGLAFRGASECQLDTKPAALAGEISTHLRPILSAVERRQGSFQGPSDGLSSRTLLGGDEIEKTWLTEDGIPTLVQMLQAGDVGLRLSLVRVLSKSPARAATEGLAGRALYDLSPEVREAAVRALQGRPAAVYRPIFLQGLRHPWPPAADHAAQALAALADRDAIPDLLTLLDEPDPCVAAPLGEGKWVVSELVRVNHLRNCLLCHAPAAGRADPVRGVVPTPGKALPVVYYERSSGPFVRADVTYLRQDFSVMQSVADADPWPAVQRFDYLVRRRELTVSEAAACAAAVAAGKSPGPASYPQRQAVLLALAELTGLQAGDSSLDWRLALWVGEDRPGK